MSCDFLKKKSIKLEHHPKLFDQHHAECVKVYFDIHFGGKINQLIFFQDMVFTLLYHVANSSWHLQAMNHVIKHPCQFLQSHYQSTSLAIKSCASLRIQ
jgi:hypothetical protein